MSRHSAVLLNDMLQEFGEDEVISVLSAFMCPVNKDVEHFLQRTSISFDRQGIAATHLVFTPFRAETVLTGYFTLANKCIDVPVANLSASLRKKLSRFCPRSNENDVLHLAMPLIAQLGKNYANGFNVLINGKELLDKAVRAVSEVQRYVGGRFAYLECEEIAALKDFYLFNGFVEFSKRSLDESGDASVSKDGRLIQMIRYI